MVDIRIEVVERAELPTLKKLSRKFWREVGEAVRAGILENILTQRQGGGGALKRNSPRTRARKQREGRGSRALVDRLHRFVKGGNGSWRLTLLPGGVGVTVDAANDELGKLVEYVKAKGYVGWDEPNEGVIGAIRAALVREIRRQFAEQAARNRARGGR